VYLGRTVSVVMPAYDVEDRIAEAVSSVPPIVDHVVVVDDASRDGTAALVEGLRRPGLRLVRHPVNQGVGAAIATGYAEALRLGSEVVAVMAGDGQMDPDDLPALLTPIALGRADYSKGNRFLRREVWRAMPLERLLGNLVLSLLTKVTSGYWQVFDSQCGYTAISGRALRALGTGSPGRAPGLGAEERAGQGSSSSSAFEARGEKPTFFSRYGYPNDLLARLRSLDARLEEVPVRPVYDGQRSGIRIWPVAYPILFVLLCSLGRRLWRQHLRPLLLGEPAASLRLGAPEAPEQLLPAPPP
jgi:glycosyltransferase involved in cell wall biosynthesis